MTSPLNLWSPQANAALSSPAEFDHHKDIWSAEVQTARLNKLFLPRTVLNKTGMFQAGGAMNKDVDFLVTGRIGSERHNRGDRVTGTQRNSISRRVKLDERPYRTSVADEYITRMFEQVDVRRGLFQSMGHALAARQEIEVMKMIGAAARTTNTASTPDPEFLEGGNSYHDGASVGIAANYGYTFNNASAAYSGGQTAAKNVLAALKKIAIVWGEQNVEDKERYCLIPLPLFYDIREVETVYPTSTATVEGGIYGNTDIIGSKLAFTQHLSGLVPLEYMGFKIMPHNFFSATYTPEVQKFRSNWTVDAPTVGAEAERSLNFTNTVGLVWQQEAVGYADVMRTGLMLHRPTDATEEMVWAMDWMGGGTLRPECAVELTQVDPG